MSERRHPPSTDQTSTSLRGQLHPVVENLGLVLEDLVVSAAGSTRLLKVVLDLPAEQTGSLSLDAVADASREISAALDAADPMGQSPYTLEVSSPGVDRPLTELRHVRRNLGRLIVLTLRDGGTVSGRVLSVGDDGTIVVLLPGAKKGMPATKQHQVAWADVAHAVVEVEFSRPDAAEPDEGVPGEQDDDLDDDDLDGDDDFTDDDIADDDIADDDEIEPPGPRS